MFATIEYHSMTAKTTANSVHTGRQMRTIVESDGARRNSSGPPRTSVDGRRAVFKTVCGLCKSEPTRASSYMWLLICGCGTRVLSITCCYPQLRGVARPYMYPGAGES